MDQPSLPSADGLHPGLLVAATSYLNSSLKEERLAWGSQLEGRGHHGGKDDRQERLEGMNRKLEGHVEFTLRKQRISRKWGQALRPQRPPPVTHVFQQGPISQRFHRPLRQ